jgi:hypothetical protein
MKRPDLKQIFLDNLLKIFWCVGWSSIGIALGLWNSRTNFASHLSIHLHYVTYFIFILIFASVSAFTVSLSGKDLRSYCASFLTAIAVGFAGDSLAGLITHFSGWIK